MEYYVFWNEMVAKTAHWRVQMENCDLLEMVSKAGIPKDAVDLTSFKQEPFVRKSKSRAVVTWKMMKEADSKLHDRVWALAQEYGYDLT
jgi:hypothetical protein